MTLEPLEATPGILSSRAPGVAMRSAAPQPQPGLTTDPAPPGAAPLEPGETWEQGSRLAGRVGQVLSKIPAVITFLPRVLVFTLVDAALPLACVAATVGGFGAVAGLGAAGVIEAMQGAKKKDAAQVLIGVTDASRGVWVGATTAHVTLHMGAPAAAVRMLGGAVHGAACIGCGVVKMTRNRADATHSERIEGTLLVGIGVCSLVAATGSLVGPAMVAQTALAAARVGYVNHEKLAAWASWAGDRAHQTGEHFLDLFRWQKDEAPAPYAGSGVGPPESG